MLRRKYTNKIFSNANCQVNFITKQSVTADMSEKGSHPSGPSHLGWPPSHHQLTGEEWAVHPVLDSAFAETEHSSEAHLAYPQPSPLTEAITDSKELLQFWHPPRIHFPSIYRVSPKEYVPILSLVYWFIIHLWNGKSSIDFLIGLLELLKSVMESPWQRLGIGEG
jgi:hypothetical protein